MVDRLLRVENVSVNYRAVKALSQASIEVERGQGVVLLGPNGSGKSTLLKAVAGLVKTASGTILLDGQPIQALPAHRRARLGTAWAPDRGRVAGTMTVKENLLAGAYLCTNAAEVRRRLNDILEDFPRLAGLQGQLAGDLSGGQRQMLVLARALMAAPRLLLVDEPFTSLSPDVLAEVITVLNRAKGQGIGLLLAEHQLEPVLKVADIIYALGSGRIVYRGTRDEFVRDKPMGTIYFDRAAAEQ